MTQKINNTYIGTELKMHIGFKYDDDKNVTLKTLDEFIVEFFCNEGKGIQRFEKSRNDFIIEGDEYYACVDTNITGPGILKMKLTAYIREYDMYGKDFHRTEVAVCNTNVRILECNEK